jgi:hypothetical protein
MTLAKKFLAWGGHCKLSVVAALLGGMVPTIVSAEIIWSGDYETGDFTQWHLPGKPDHPQFAGVPAYGRPVPPDPFTGSALESYYGDGSLMELVTQPVRQGRYAAKVTVKNSLAGYEPDDCDNGNCTRRRSELNMHLALPADYDGMPYLSERWVSISHYLPSNWDSDNGNGWGPTVFQIKSPKTNNISPTFSIVITNHGWQIWHRWSDVENPSTFDAIPWQYQMYYDAQYPSASSWSEGLSDFPDTAVSRAALSDLNKGGWTDWVIRIRFDGRGSKEGGNGFLTVWKRAGDADWVKVLHVLPKVTTRGGMTFDRGIGYIVPDSGFGPLAGMYMAKEQVWGLPNNRVLYNDNMKVGSSMATFEVMSPDASAPGSPGHAEELPPNPPELLPVE